VTEVRLDVAGAVATITIDRPQRRNALNESVLGELAEALESARLDPAVRVIVLTGAGDKAFSAGGDLAPSGGGTGPLAMHHRRGAFADLLLSFRRLGKPTIARINGDALGGGFGLMLACDLVVARDDARLGCPEIDVGLFPMMITALIHRSLPRKLALELMLTGRKLTGKDAAELHLANRAVPAAELDAAVAELAASLVSKSPAILRLGLEAYYATADMGFEEALRFLHQSLTINTFSEDAAEGVMAFIQKRAPDWKGR
jgi:enoyl-CoA hydratase